MSLVCVGCVLLDQSPSFRWCFSSTKCTVRHKIIPYHINAHNFLWTSLLHCAEKQHRCVALLLLLLRYLTAPLRFPVLFMQRVTFQTKAPLHTNNVSTRRDRKQVLDLIVLEDFGSPFCDVKRVRLNPHKETHTTSDIDTFVISLSFFSKPHSWTLPPFFACVASLEPFCVFLFYFASVFVVIWQLHANFFFPKILVWSFPLTEKERHLNLSLFFPLSTCLFLFFSLFAVFFHCHVCCSVCCFSNDLFISNGKIMENIKSDKSNTRSFICSNIEGALFLKRMCYTRKMKWRRGERGWVGKKERWRLNVHHQHQHHHHHRHHYLSANLSFSSLSLSLSLSLYTK